MIILSFRVIDLRGSPVTKFLHKPNRIVVDETLQRSIRGHGNLVEYAPLFLILMFILELSGAPQTQLYFSGITFTNWEVDARNSFFFFETKYVFKNWWYDTNFCWFLGSHQGVDITICSLDEPQKFESKGDIYVEDMLDWVKK